MSLSDLRSKQLMLQLLAYDFDQLEALKAACFFGLVLDKTSSFLAFVVRMAFIPKRLKFVTNSNHSLKY